MCLFSKAIIIYSVLNLNYPILSIFCKDISGAIYNVICHVNTQLKF